MGNTSDSRMVFLCLLLNNKKGQALVGACPVVYCLGIGKSQYVYDQRKH